MLKKTITYQNLDGQQVSKDLYFNISANELVKKQADSDETFADKLKQIAASNKLKEIYPTVLEFMAEGYGVRTADGDFEKDPTGAAWEKFQNTLAFQALMDELLIADPQNNGNRLADFINGMLPADVIAKAQEQNATPGFRPGADTSRPTPPVAGQQPVAAAPVSAPVVSEPVVAEPQPVQVAPAEPVVAAPAPAQEIPVQASQDGLTQFEAGQIQQTQTPREPELPGAAPQQ